ncbi:MAG: hypothetical protein ACLQLG_05115 [Thermoguttaceae bacterium]
MTFEFKTRYLGRAEAARYLSISARNLDQLAASGTLSPCRPSPRRVVYDVIDLDNFMANTKAPAVQPAGAA